MKAFELWAAYVESTLGVPVENAAEKFDAVADKAAWEAVAVAAAPVKQKATAVVAPAPLVK